jgi:hypothetical protein
MPLLTELEILFCDVVYIYFAPTVLTTGSARIAEQMTGVCRAFLDQRL